MPEGEGRQGEGGLRTQGCFKRSEPEKPLITVVTVVFNGAPFLEETILSVINQTYDNVEYIIIDGGSTDGTLDIIRKYEHAIDYWVSEKDGGIYDAMNKSAILAFGKWLMFINAGDKLIYIDQFSLYNPYITKSCYVINEERKQLERNPLTKLYLTRNTPCHQSIQYLMRDFRLFHPEYGIESDYEQLTRVVNRSFKASYSESIVYFAMPGASSVRKDSFLKSYKKRIGTVRKNIGLMYAFISLMHLLRRSLVVLASGFIKIK